MDSKIAFLNLANDYYRSEDAKIFLNNNDPTPCKSCSKSYYFIDKKYNFCNKCFLNNCCNVDFDDNKVIIKMNNTNNVIFIEDISILSIPKEQKFERSNEVNSISLQVAETANV